MRTLIRLVTLIAVLFMTIGFTENVTFAGSRGRSRGRARVTRRGRSRGRSRHRSRRVRRRRRHRRRYRRRYYRGGRWYYYYGYGRRTCTPRYGVRFIYRR